MEGNKNITINGVEFTPEMLEVLKFWGEGKGECNTPLSFLNTLTEIQDYLCEEFANFGDEDIKQYREIAELVCGITLIKSDLKAFIKY